MEQTIRLVAVDLDGTFLAPDRTISQRGKDMVATLVQQGIYFTFITGRPRYAVEKFAAQAGVREPIVACNGALVFQGDETIARRTFSLLPLRALMEQACAAGLTVLYSVQDVEYAMAPTAWTATRQVNIKAPQPEDWRERAAEKVNIFSGGQEQAFRAILPALKHAGAAYSISIYGLQGCELVAAGVDKALGLSVLCERLGVSLSHVLAVGDNENDLAMLRAAGIGCAVANATAEAKACADYVCQRENTEGVIEAVKRFVWRDENA